MQWFIVLMYVWRMGGCELMYDAGHAAHLLVCLSYVGF